MEPGKRRSRWWSFGCLGLVIVTVAGGCAAFFVAADGVLDDAGKVGNAYFRALGAGDGATACGDMTRSAQVQFAEEYRQGTCPQAVAVLVGSLSAADRAKLGATKVTAYKFDSSVAYATCSDNPLQVNQVTLNEEGSTWLVAQLV